MWLCLSIWESVSMHMGTSVGSRMHMLVYVRMCVSVSVFTHLCVCVCLNV